MDQQQPTQPPHASAPGSVESPARVNGMPEFPAARESHGEYDPSRHRMDLNFPLLGTITAASGMLIFVVILSVQAWYSHEMQKEIRIKSYNVQNLELQDLQRQELAHIDSYSWVDNNHQVVTLPIERAMELTIQEYQQRQQAADKNATEKQ